ncbi:RIP metalloprotease RseP [Halomonas halocynthiae]|uniref:RIP metalloprotease RseP n=1 Tax=Halomonas halocynthiae TaxID=176290 RepID=UPI0003FAAA19|nr:RIP metalloprotease RseP [Halomonas halocynthiae]
MSLIQNVLAVIVVLGLLVTFHEFGHFWVARRCGVKVLRFSVGFGRPLWSRYDRHGTEFAVAAIPLGGYVKMLDEREGEVDPAELDQAFNRKNVWQRIAIVAAGPVANFLLAIVAYWLVFVVGTTAVVPAIGHVTPGSPAEQAGLQAEQEITAVQGEVVRSWEDVGLKLIASIGAVGTLDVEARSENSQVTRSYLVPVDNWLVGQDPPRPLQSLGVEPWRPDVPAVIGQLLDNEPAQQAGLAVGDRVLRVDGEPVADWSDLVQRIQASPGRELAFEVERDGDVRFLNVVPGQKANGEQRVGYIGAGVEAVNWPSSALRDIRYGPIEAVGQAAQRTGEMTLLTLGAIRKMLVGLISPSNLSGPITIARIAGDSARSGFEGFVSFLAYLSISLGVLNLLPIPMLDGGHLMFYLAEAVRGKPVSERIQDVGLRIGIALVGALMLMALYFDVMRLW